MKRATGFFVSVAAALLFLVPLFVEQARAQQTDGVFVGRGRVARPSVPHDKNTEDKNTGDDRSSARPYDEEDLKPMIPARMLAEIVSLEQQCLDAVNRQREAHGLEPLNLSEDLLQVARYYSRRMAQEKFFSHTDPEGRSVRQRVNEAGIKWRVLGENLAYSNGYVNPVAASIRGWMESPGHRRNILDPSYRQTAIGAWISPNGTIYFTEIFMK